MSTSQPARFDIKPQPLASALNAFAVQSHQTILFTPEIAAGKSSLGIQGNVASDAALAKILAGTGLASSRSPDGMILIADAADAKGASATSDPPLAPNGATNDQSQNRQSYKITTTQGAGSLEEIVVTAQKRTELLLDVPVPVSVISGTKLADNNQLRLSDYFSEVPGLSIAPSTASTQTLSIRGITTGAVPAGPPAPGPAVGIMVDDVPFGGTGGGDTMVPDFDPGDLARIEVLRGPQGTLYGASSLGGLIKYVTVDPSTDAVKGQMTAGISSVYNGAELGYTVRGSVNLPITNNFAVRASVFSRLDPGYIDNPVLGIKGINENRASGGHLAALWKVSDDLSVKLSALFQESQGDGTNDVTPNPPAITGFPPLGDLQQAYIRGIGPFKRTLEAFSASITDQIGNITLTSLTGFNTYQIRDETDNTWSLGQLTQTYYGVVGTLQTEDTHFGRFTQELRLAAPLAPNVDLLVGGFYSHAVDHYRWDEQASNPTTGQIVGNWGTFNLTSAPITYTDYAIFGDLTYRITDRFDFQVGGRENLYDVVGKPWIYKGLFATVWIGPPICTTDNCVAFPQYTLRQSAFTYLVTPRFKFTPDIMGYARLASGYREGGANAGTPGAPLAYGPDKTTNYELGVKGDFFAHTFSVDASVYYIEWKNIQIPLFDSIDDAYTGNGGAAKSQGVEVTVESKPVEGLTIGAWVAFSDAELTEYVPSIFGYPGDKLPNTPHFSGNFSLNETFPLWRSTTGLVGGTIGYVGAREDVFSQSSPQRQYLAPYGKIDLRAGIKFEDWTVNLYCNNVTDKRGIISGGYGNSEPYAFYLIQPRTIGLMASKSF